MTLPRRVLLPAFLLLLGALAGCAHALSEGIERLPMPRAAQIVGDYRRADGFWVRDLELKADRTFRYVLYTDTFERIVVDGTWTLEGGMIVTTGAKGEGIERYAVVRDATGRRGLLGDKALARASEDNPPGYLRRLSFWEKSGGPR